MSLDQLGFHSERSCLKVKQKPFTFLIAVRTFAYILCKRDQKRRKISTHLPCPGTVVMSCHLGSISL